MRRIFQWNYVPSGCPGENDTGPSTFHYSVHFTKNTVLTNQLKRRGTTFLEATFGFNSSKREANFEAQISPVLCCLKMYCFRTVFSANVPK